MPKIVDDGRKGLKRNLKGWKYEWLLKSLQEMGIFRIISPKLEELIPKLSDISVDQGKGFKRT